MGKKKKFEQSNKTICEYIFSDYINDNELDETSKVMKNMQLLIDNRLAYKISGIDSFYNIGLSGYRIACMFIQKYNSKISEYRRKLSDYEAGGSEQIYAKDDKRIIELSKYSLEEGTYYAQVGKSDYMILQIKFEQDEYDYVNYTLYFVGKKWKKWRDRYYDLYDKYKAIVRENKTDKIYYTDGRPTNCDVIFKPFDQVVFKDKEKVMKYIDNFIENIPKYYEHGMIPKLSILIYGKPGTGKSTFAKALSKYMNICAITSISPSYFSENGDDMGGRLKGTRKRTVKRGIPSISVLDDVDCVCKSREIDDSSQNSEVLSNLLNFLDNPPAFDFKANNGVRYPISVVVASTNYYDKLDDAVTRYGRFDLKIEMNDFTKDEALEMCSIYGLDLKELAPDCDKKGFTISPSYLQAKCLENIDKAMKEV